MAIVIATTFFSCNKSTDLLQAPVVENTSVVPGTHTVGTTTAEHSLPSTSFGVYNVTLESVVANTGGTYTWTWSVQKPSGTVQDLSHWDITLGTCVNIGNVISGAISSDGTNYTYTSFVPTLAPDPTISTCGTTSSVLKFELANGSIGVGTLGATKSYYRLTIDIDVQVANVGAYYKSGSTTGCGTLTVPGFGCENLCDVTATSLAGTILCYDGTTTVTVTFSGGTGPYTVPFGASEITITSPHTFSNLPAGDYSYTVKDANGCTATTSGTIIQPTLLVASSSATPILCYGGSSTVTVSASGGTGLITGTGSFTVSAGDYSYTVTDANGCTATTSGTISQPSALSCSTVGTNVFPSGSGSVSATVSGGTSPYNFVWTGPGTFTATTQSIENLGAGVYTVTVTDKNNCTTSCSYTVTQCLGAGGGKTLGFWSNKNGQALITPAFIAQLNTLYLRNANGSNFDPTSSSQLSSWLTSASATNMAYMLSAQLAATQLNVLQFGVNGVGVNGNALIYAPGTGITNALGFATVQAVMDEANTLLSGGITIATTVSILSGNSLRPLAEALKNALDKSNNNENFLVACN